MSKARNTASEAVKKPSLWSKFTKWLASKFTCFGKDIQDDIQEHLEDIGEEILAPIVETGADVLGNLVNAEVPGIGGKILTSVVDSTGDTVVEMLGGTTSADGATS